MRIGVAEGPVPYDLDLVDERLAAKLAELGFTGIFAHFGYGQGPEPADLDRGKCRQARDVLAAYGRVGQTWGWSPNLAHPDDSVRADEVRRLRAALEVGAERGPDGVTGGCGSRNPRGGYWPHRENHTAEAQTCLVRSLQEAAPAAESLGLRIALECHVLTTLDSPERVRGILDAVNSPAVGVNLDPVNFLDDLDTVYDSPALLDRVFEYLDRYAVCGHIKDVYPEDRLVLHLSETLLGDGEFDLRSYVAHFEELLPDGSLFIEHLREDLVPMAKSCSTTCSTTWRSVSAPTSRHGVIEGFRLARFELPPPRLLGDSQVRVESHWIGSLEPSSSSGHVGLRLFPALLSPLPPLAELERVFETTVAGGLIGESPFALTNRLVRPRGGQIAGNMFAEAIDHALWDLQGKELGLPRYRPLGGSRNRVRAYASGLDFHLSTDESCGFFAAAAADGFQAFKLKVGYPDLQLELARLDAISRAVGPDAVLMVDANEAWSPKEAIVRAHTYRDRGLNVYWIEDPCLRDDFEGPARVANETPFVRLNAGAYLDAEGRQRLLEHRAIDVLNVCGDIGTAMQSARVAAHNGVPVSVGNSLGEVSVHAAAALPEFTWIEYSFLGYERLLADPILPQEGYLVAPERPGHGLALSERGREELASHD